MVNLWNVTSLRQDTNTEYETGLQELSSEVNQNYALSGPAIITFY